MAQLPPALSQVKKKKGKDNPGKSVLQDLINVFPFGKVSDKIIIDFTRGLAVMLKARLSLIQALDTMISETTDSNFKSTLKRVRRDVKSGQSLADSLSKHPSIFDTFYIHLVEVGELAGVLDNILFRLADYKAKRHSIQQKVKMAMIYPGMVLGVATGAILFLLLVIVPTFAEMYRDFDAELPELTRYVLFVSNWVNEYFFIILVTGAALVWGTGYALRNKEVRYSIDKAKMNIPFFGELFLKTIVVRFCQTLGTLLQSGITLVEGLTILTQSSNNLLVKEATGNVLKAVKRGGSLGKALRKSRVFPPIVLQMITVGEETAELDEMLLHVSDHFREEMDLKVESMTSVIEPLLIITLGIILGFLIVAMYLPMFELMNVIG